ncbi:unnamed protein product [Rhizophagus irregularis]|nr:unnamed protein product [Rhizophagus irregularis]
MLEFVLPSLNANISRFTDPFSIILGSLESPCSGLYRRKKSSPIELLDSEIFTFKALWKALDLVYMNEKRAYRLDHWIWRYLHFKLRYKFLTYILQPYNLLKIITYYIFNPKLEDDLFAWISEKRANGNAITQKLIINKAIYLSKSPELLANNLGITRFKFSNKWLNGFLERYDFSERCKITVIQQLPLDLIEKQNIFLSYIIYLRIYNKYELKYICNMDEMPI